MDAAESRRNERRSKDRLAMTSPFDRWNCPIAFFIPAGFFLMFASYRVEVLRDGERADVRGDGDTTLRAALRLRALADARRKRGRGSRAGDVSQGVSRLRVVHGR